MPAFLVGMVVIGDKGFAGREFERDMSELGIAFASPDRRDEKRHHGNLSMIRHRTESIINTAERQLPLEQHGARGPHGVLVCVAQRMLVLAAAIWHKPGHRRTCPALTDHL